MNDRRTDEPLDDEMAHAIATLARALGGLVEIAAEAGIDSLPRPSFMTTTNAAAGPAVLRAVSGPQNATPAPPARPAEASKAAPIAAASVPPAAAGPKVEKAPEKPLSLVASKTGEPVRESSGATPASATARAAARWGMAAGAPAADAAPPIAEPARAEGASPSEPGSPPASVPVSAAVPGPAPTARTVLQDRQEDSARIGAVLAQSIANAEKLRILHEDVVGDCHRCKLHRGRTKLVFGVGNPNAELVFVGEGPGAEEDRQGIPFVGAAGQLLTKMIEAMGFARDEVYICNVVKCRPPNNRDPEPDEVDACEGFLQAQLAVLKPKVIVGLGRHASQTLLRTDRPISQLRGKWARYEGVDFMPTFHPSYLLRDPTKKRDAWSDLQLVLQHFGRTPPARK